jgi:polyhydroxyalkanoate synthesis regulator phasin
LTPEWLSLLLGPLGLLVGLILAVVGLMSGSVSPKHVVSDLREENVELRAELATVNQAYVQQVEQNAELRGEIAAVRHQLEGLRQEVAELRRKMWER